MISVVVVFVCWSCKSCLYFRLLKLFNLFNLFSLLNMSWTDNEIESLITFYSSVLVSGARNFFATGVKNRHQKPTPVFWRRYLERVSLALGRVRFDESGFGFTVNPDLDSLANRTVWIRGCRRKWRRCCSFALWYWCHFRFRQRIHVKTGFARFANPDSDSRTEWTD